MEIRKRVVVCTNQDCFFAHKQRGYKVGNTGVELSQITGLDRDEGVACAGNQRLGVYLRSIYVPHTGPTF